MIREILQFIISMFASILYVSLGVLCVRRANGEEVSKIVSEIFAFLGERLSSIDAGLAFFITVIVVMFIFAEWTINYLSISDISIEGIIRLVAFIVLSMTVPYGICTVLILVGAKEKAMLLVAAGILHLVTVAYGRGFVFSVREAPERVQTVGTTIKTEKNLPDETGLPPRPKL